MNNHLKKSKKRKLSHLEDGSEPESRNKEDLDSNSDMESQGDSASEDSISTCSDSFKNSNSKFMRKSRTSKAIALLSESSESGDENSEKCAICLRSIVNQEVGNPEVCDHLFCSVCIIEWSKNSNVCPLDRQQFSIILVRANKDGCVIKKVSVEEPQVPRIENVESGVIDDTVCEICGSGDREDIMLLCDNCDRGFHTICLTPPLENIPDENEWFCPNCESSFRGPNGSTAIATSGLDDFLENVSTRFRSLRPRVQLVRTRLLERVRVTINRIVENYVLRQSDDDPTSDDYFSDEVSDESDDSLFSLESSLDHVLADQPSTSGAQAPKSAEVKMKANCKKIKENTRKKCKKIVKRKRNGGSGRKKSSGKKKTSVAAKKKSSRRKIKVKTTRTKKVKIENPDGTIAEKIVKTRTYKRRRQKRRKKKVKSFGSGKRGLRVKSITTPKTVKGRLALMLGMVPPKKPGQLLPDVKIKPNNSTSVIDLNRARAGIPKLHIFGPRDELQCFSSESDQEDIVINNSGGVAMVAQHRSNLSRLRDRKKAALVLQSIPPSSTSKPKPVIDPPSERIDILGSILDSQAIWHSKDTNTNVKINSDGSIEVIKNKENNVLPKVEAKTIDVREGHKETVTQAPMYPGSGNRAGGFRPNRNNYGDSRSNQDMFAPRTGQSQSGMSFNRFGGPARNDREGYTNYLNNIPQGPTPFCRGGPPLRFRMPPRQQLRRISFPTRNRPTDQTDGSGADSKIETKEKKEPAEETGKEVTKVQEDEDVDLYSDIENTDKMDNSGPEDSVSNYPALGPPPEPSAFLLGLDENGDFGVAENKDKSDVYDPAEPCDSEDEMVIDENQETASTPDKKEQQSEVKINVADSIPSQETINKQGTPPQKASSEEDDEEDCPIFSIYSSATREFSQKEEDERQREIAEDKRKLEEMKFQGEQKVNILAATVSQPEKQNLVPSDMEKKTDCLKQTNSGHQIETRKDNKVTSDLFSELENETKEKVMNAKDRSLSPSSKSARFFSRSRSKSVENDSSGQVSPSNESERARKSKSPKSVNETSLSPRGKSTEKGRWNKGRSKRYDSDSDIEHKKSERKRKNDKIDEVSADVKNKEKNVDRDKDSDSEMVSHKIATGLEGLEVEEVSSDGDAFADKRSLSSLSLSDFSHRSKRSKSPVQLKKKRKNKKRKIIRSKGGKNNEEGELDDSEKDNRLNELFGTTKNIKDEIANENDLKSTEKKRGPRSASTGSERQILGSKENKKGNKEKGKDLAWKKPSKKEKNYREGKKRSKERARSKSNERRRSKSKSPSPRKDKKKNKERKKKTDKKKDIERYDVRKIVKNKEIRKTDAFGRDIASKSRSISKSRSRSPIRERSRNMLRRDSRSFSRSRSRSFRRVRSPLRRHYRTRSRSKSNRRTYSRSRSRSRNRKTRKKVKAKDRLKVRSRSRGRKSRSLSRGKRRSLTRSRSRSPVVRVVRSKKTRSRKSWSHHVSKSPSFSPRRSRSMTRSPVRVRRSSYSRSMSSSWSRGRSPLPLASSLEKLTVVLTTKDKKKWKKKKEGKKSKKNEKKRKKTGNSKEVFASGDNVLVSVNFRNNSNTTSNNSGGMLNTESRNIHLNSLSPCPGADSSRKKKRSSDYESERVTKKLKKSNPISKKIVDVALSSACSKRAKKLTRLSEKDAEVILNRKPVAVIDLDISPYREQTPSPVNVVVVSDSGSGDEGKEHTPQRSISKSTPIREPNEVQDTTANQPVKAPAPSSPIDSGYIPTSGPKTPPEPQIKFSINKPQQLRPIANPLGDDDDEDDEVDEDEPEPRVESLDRRIEKELDVKSEVPHKGPNTPPAPRGPSTPKEPPSPQSSPDAYDPFEPTKSRSPSPGQADKENRPSPKMDGKNDQLSGNVQSDALPASVILTEAIKKISEPISEKLEENSDNLEKSESLPLMDESSNLVIHSQPSNISVTDNTSNESPERKGIMMMSTPQSKMPSPAIQKAYTPAVKQVQPMITLTSTASQLSFNVNPSTDVFSSLSPTKTNRSNTCTTQNIPVTGMQRLQHRLGSPVNRTPSAVKSASDKWSIPRADSNELFSSGSYINRSVNKRNGESAKQPRPLQDATNETIDPTVVDMDDSPYSPASSEGDDLFDPPIETSKPSQSNSKASSVAYKGLAKPPPPPPPLPPPGKSPVKQMNKFDLLFGIGGPTVSPLKVPNKKTTVKTGVKPTTNALPPKPQKRSTTKINLMHKMDEDQLRILDELPSSAVELQVKDKFLKKLNRQERVVDEVKTVLKPHYARKHITKDEYKDILRRAVPKICHSRSGEINPSKIQSLIEAYVRKFRHAKKKGLNITSAKPKVKKTMFS